MTAKTIPVETGRCLGCGRIVKPHLGELVYHRPDGSAWWIHNRKTCQELYDPDLPVTPQEATK